MSGYAEVFDSACESEAVGRYDHETGLHIHEILFIKRLRVNYGAVNVSEQLEFVRAPDVVSVTRRPVGHNTASIDLFYLVRFEGINHPELIRHSPDPAVGFY